MVKLLLVHVIVSSWRYQEILEQKTFINFTRFSCMIFWTQNVEIPPNCILLLFESAKLCAPCISCPACLISYVLLCPSCLVSYMLSCLMCFVSSVSLYPMACVSRALCPMCLHALWVLIPYLSLVTKYSIC